MKISLLLLLLLNISFHVFANDLSFYGHAGNVHTVTEESYSLIENPIGEYIRNNEYYTIHTYTFNKAGNLIELTWHRMDGSISSRRFFKYDENNKITNVETLNTIKNNVIEKHIFSYDSSGNLIEDITYDAYCNLTSKNKYDAKERVISETTFKNDGSIQNFTKWEYDDMDNITKITYYDEAGTREKTHIIKYDENGKLFRDEKYNSNGELINLSQTNYVQNVSKETYYYIKDATGKMILQSIISSRYNGGINRITTFDEYGNITKVEKYEYEYDSRGNYIKLKTYSEIFKFGGVFLEPKTETIRTFTYYD